jgi:peptide/nickel transport system permease protein
MATTSSTGTEFSGDIPAAYLAEGEELPPGISPSRLAWRRLRRNKTALGFGALFIAIVVLCLLAPVYSHDIAHIGPATENITGTVKVGGKSKDIVSLLGIPIGPTWTSHYLLGADDNGRDVAVRLLYGGRNSLEIGFVATIITMVLAIFLGVISGYYRGITDGFVNRGLDIIWAFPAVLLGLTLGTVLATGGIGPLKGTNLLVPAVVIGIVYIPYVAKPLRGQMLTLREREFVDAARQQGLGHMRIMFSEVLPNLASTILVFIPLILANAILLEAALTYLGAGVQPPNPSWGTMISDGISTIPEAFHNVLVPGIMLVLTVLSINVFGDGLRDALDPRAKVRIGR